MIEEIKLKYYSDNLKAGFNDYKAVYCSENKVWHTTYLHLGRIVYAQRKSFNKLRESLTHKDYIVQEFIPF